MKQQIHGFARCRICHDTCQSTPDTAMKTCFSDHNVSEPRRLQSGRKSTMQLNCGPLSHVRGFNEKLLFGCRVRMKNPFFTRRRSHVLVLHLRNQSCRSCSSGQIYVRSVSSADVYFGLEFMCDAIIGAVIEL